MAMGVYAATYPRHMHWVSTKADDSSGLSLAARAERWAADDPDPHTQAEIRALLAHVASGGANASSELHDLTDRFAGALEFGTAGLRGIIGGGPNRMNRAVVARTTWGLAQHLLASVPDAAKRGVVVGYDGRKMSREFAEDTCAILAAAGVRAVLSAEPVPTPLCAFAVHYLHAAAGIMITASHNPPEYNGYKVYWENAAQIISPTDVAIAKRIDAAPAAKKIPRPSLEEARAKKLFDPLPPAVERAYLDAVAALSVHPKEGDRLLTIVYTPLHGVGDKLARLAFGEAGFRNVSSVPEQQKPDGAFPTVAFPNPEEKGAMDLSFALARQIKADLVLANDPDADRLAVAVPDRASPSGYFQLTGNQVGILLGHYLLTEKPVKGPRCVLASIVSSPLLGHIAKALDVHYEETLTGFKWIANRAMELERERHLEFVFGYEEALGYTVGDAVRDKDGISAAVMMSELLAVLRSRGRGLMEELEAIHRRYGLFVSSQVNVTKKGAAGLEEIRAIMNALRASPPRKIGAHDVLAVSDYEAATRTTSATGETAKLTLPKSNVLTFDLVGGSRIIARPSGTEPKVKFYFDVREPIAENEALAAAETRAVGMMKALSDAFVAIAMPSALA